MTRIREKRGRVGIGFKVLALVCLYFSKWLHILADAFC